MAAGAATGRADQILPPLNQSKRVSIKKKRELQKKCTTNATAEASSNRQTTGYVVTTVEKTSMGNTHTDTDSVIEQKNAREEENLLNCSEKSSLERMNLISSTNRRVISAQGNEICYKLSKKSGPGYHEKLITTEVYRKRNPSASECETNGNNTKEEEYIQSNKLTKSLRLVITPDWLCATTQQNTKQREVKGWPTDVIPVADELDNSSAQSQVVSCEPVLGVIELISIKLAVTNNCTKGSFPNYS